MQSELRVEEWRGGMNKGMNDACDFAPLHYRWRTTSWSVIDNDINAFILHRTELSLRTTIMDTFVIKLINPCSIPAKIPSEEQHRRSRMQNSMYLRKWLSLIRDSSRTGKVLR